MGHKVHPIGFRIGVIRDWQAKWYADKHYAEFLQEDLKLRKAIQKKYADAAISLVEIERQANQVSVAIHTARPGIVIGRGGQRVDEMRLLLEKLIGKRVQLNIQEIQQPELDAHLVARNVAEQIERRIAYRRAMKQSLLRTMQAGAKGIKVSCAGRLGGAEIARRLTMHDGQVPLHTLRADVDYGLVEARTPMGRIGVKVWIYKGEVLPERKVKEVEEAPVEMVAEVSTGAAPTVDAEEKPTMPVAETVVEAASPPETKVEEVKEVPGEVVAEVSTGAAPTVDAEEKPAKQATKRTTRAKHTAEPKAEEAEESSAGPVAGLSTEEELSAKQGEGDVTT